MTTDTRTTNRNYPKPFPSNLLAADVIRLRDALDAIDTDMAARPETATINGLIDTAVNQLLDGAPAALDTLNELAASLGDDANLAASIATDLATKLDKTGGVLSGQITLPNNPSAGTLQASTALYTEQTVEGHEKNWQLVSNTYAASSGDRLMLDSSNGAFTVTLPSSPSQGDYVQFADGSGQLSTNSVTVVRNGSNIQSTGDDLEIDVDNHGFKLVFTDSTNGWRLA